jgi:hypothetical protein
MTTTMLIDTSVNTKKVVGRRKLRFETIDQAMAEVDRLAALDQQGKLKLLGNWKFGQILNHLAVWQEFFYDGFPPVGVPFPIRLILRLMRGRILRKGLTSGAQLPGVPNGTLGAEVVPTEQGLARFRKVMTRMKTDPPIHPSPVFGRLTQEQMIALALRHTELHLSFVTE